MGKGLPIGNLNSQFFANVYLNALDQFVKHELKCPHYLRYCDDFVLLAEGREQLVEWWQRIRSFLRERLRLELNDARERLRPVGDGVDFLGYIVRADYLLARRLETTPALKCTHTQSSRLL
ncbi:MAG: RNA-directed DNA polymerase [Sulfuritalea sp.]|nr:RNA-directed DNA polymerase [Sulfuritalea sp.]